MKYFRLSIKNKYSNAFFLLLLLIMLSFFATDALAVDKKVVIFIMDRVNYQDLEKGNYPMINKVRNQGAEGLMNVRSKAMFLPDNSESSYLTIGSGVRIASPDIKQITVSGEALRIVKPASLFKEENSNNTIGLLGEIARENGLKVGLVSSSGGVQPFYGSVLMAMDDKGLVPYGNISDQLITRDTSNIGGWKSDNNKMLSAFKAIYNKADIVFIDYSDTNRVYQNHGSQADVNKAISRGDEFLGSVLKAINSHTELIIISPNPSVGAIKSLNYSLAPVIISKPNDNNGYSISSNNTRRLGLVLNLDLIPTIYDYLGVKIKENIIGEPIRPITSAPKLKGYYREAYLTNLSKSRIIMHAVFYLLLFFAFWYYKYKKNLNIKFLLCYTIVTYHLSGLLVGSFVNYSWYIFDGFSVLILAVIFGRLFLQLAHKKGHLTSLLIIGGLTSLIIVIEALFFPETVMGTPFGFNDVFIGGRFYGLNNDIMGIMLGASTLAIFTLLEKYKLSTSKSASLAFIYFLVLTIVLSPFYGVNVGGSITALVMLFISLAVLLNKKVNWQRVALLIVLVMIIQVGISALDNLINHEVTHAGKAVHSIATQGISRVLQIIAGKLSQVAFMAIVPPWNLVLGIQCYALYKYKKLYPEIIAKLKGKYSYLYKGSQVLVWGIIVCFLFNDTGIVAVDLMLIYLTITITLLLEEDKLNNEIN